MTDPLRPGGSGPEGEQPRCEVVSTEQVTKDGTLEAGIRCGLWKGHDGPHSVLIPSGVPWAKSEMPAHDDGQLAIVPCDLDEANAFVRQHHRHHQPVVGHKFSLACAQLDGAICGVCIVSRPVSRILDDGLTLEVTRVATDGTRNACSALYGAARRSAFALGYKRLVTYTLPSEGGASLRGAGWRLIGEAGGGSWARKSRPRVDKHPTQGKLRWEVTA